jgi:LuxR family transcriptional regulator, regulator of acetate metabolism
VSEPEERPAGRPDVAVGAMAALRQALGRLRAARSLEHVFRAATEETCNGLGFDRAALFSVDGAEARAESAHFAEDPVGAERFLRLARSQPHPVTNSMVQLLRRRQPVLVDGHETPGGRIEPLTEALGATPYVATPIMPDGRVIGVLYADRAFSGQPVERVDLELLSAYSEGLGYALERTVLLERLHSQRRAVRELTGTAVAAIDELSEAPLEIAASPEPAALATARSRRTIQATMPESSPVARALTRRELEVLALMAVGISNGGIARRLVISEYTVKSHVKHILRKLGADNRAEAVSRYHLALRPAGPPTEHPTGGAGAGPADLG